jgi:hypothetical protein
MSKWFHTASVVFNERLEARFIDWVKKSEEYQLQYFPVMPGTLKGVMVYRLKDRFKFRFNRKGGLIIWKEDDWGPRPLKMRLDPFLGKLYVEWPKMPRGRPYFVVDYEYDSGVETGANTVKARGCC